MIAKAVCLTLISILAKGFGFLKELLLANFFGTNEVVDAYLMAISIPSIFLGWLTAVSVGYTPIYKNNLKDTDNRSGDRYTDSLITFVLGIGIVLLFFSVLFSRELVQLCGKGLSESTQQITTVFLKIALGYVVIDSLSRILTAKLHCYGDFIRPGLAGLLTSMVQAVSIILGAAVSTFFLPFGILLSYLVQFIMLLKISRGYGYTYKIRFGCKEKLMQTSKVSFPAFVTLLASDINAFVDKVMASGLRVGSISALNYGFMIREFFHFVFGTAISTMIYPEMAGTAAEGNYSRMQYLIIKATELILVIFIPITAGGIYLSDSIMRIIYYRGQFDEYSLQMTSITFSAYMIGVTATVLNDIYAKVFYSYQQGKTNLILGIASMSINVILDFFLVKSIGIGGLALATSVSGIVILPIYIVSIFRKHREMDLAGVGLIIMKIIAATTCMIIGMKIIDVILTEVGFYYVTNLFLKVIGGIIIYSMCCLIFHIEYAEYIIGFFYNKIRGLLGDKK